MQLREHIQSFDTDIQKTIFSIAEASKTISKGFVTCARAYDEKGNQIEQVSIDIPQTKAVAKAIRDNKLQVRLAHMASPGPRES